MFKNNRNLIIIALIAVVNAVGYGIIIPVLYSYSLKFGLSDFENGLLFALFSLCQFLSTPIIGRLSDKFGRKPLLVISLIGTALSFFLMAFAPNAIVLFIARALDGITAGNIPVASAVISDTTAEKDRARGFGVIGASFGFGFVFGPAISALTVGISDIIPFIIAGVLSIIAVIITAIYLPETNKHLGEVKKGKLFDFAHLFHALFDKNVGVTLIIYLLYWLAFSLFIYGFQPVAVKVYNMSANQISLLFTSFGVVGLVVQLFILPKVVAGMGIKKAYKYSLILSAAAFFMMYLIQNTFAYIVANILLGFPSSLINPLTQTILSEETDAKSQGSILGLSSSYMSIGQIIGPLVGGAMATISTPSPFLAAGALTVVCFILSFSILKPGIKKNRLFSGK